MLQKEPLPEFLNSGPGPPLTTCRAWPPRYDVAPARATRRASDGMSTACTKDGESTSGTRARDQAKRTYGRECGRSRACDGSSAKPSHAQARVNEGPTLRRPLPNAHTNERTRGVGALSTCRARARTTTHTIHERHLESDQTLQRTSAAQTRYDTRLDIARARTRTREIEAQASCRPVGRVHERALFCQ